MVDLVWIWLKKSGADISGYFVHVEDMAVTKTGCMAVAPTTSMCDFGLVMTVPAPVKVVPFANKLSAGCCISRTVSYGVAEDNTHLNVGREG